MRRFAAETGGHPWDVTTDQMLAWLGAQVWATETRRSYRAALCSFYRWAHISGRMASNPAALLPPIKPPVRLPRPTPEGVLAAALLAATPRVQLMVLLAAREGLRRSEIAQVHSRDLEHDLTGWSLHVHGKGSKDRLVPLSEQVWTLLSGAPAGFLFPGAIDGHLSPAYVGKLVSRVLGVGWSAHTLRHRFATVAYAGERDLLAVQMLLGHSKPETTRLYVLIPNASLRAAVAWAA
jgi:integrase/recombinase XerC